MLSITTGLMLLGVSVLGVAFLAGSEAALLSASRVRLRHRAEQGHAGAHAALRVVSQHDRLFSTILATENLCIIAGSSLATALAFQLSPQAGVFWATLVMGAAVIVFGEITPKTFAAAHADAVAEIVAPVIEWLMRLLRPIVWVLGAMPRALLRALPGEGKSSRISGEELRTMVGLSRASGGISESEGELLRRVLELRRVTARDLMTPRTDIAAVAARASSAKLVEAASKQPGLPVLVYGRNYDDLLGYVPVRELLGLCAHARATAPRDLMRPLPKVPASLRGAELLRSFRESGAPVAAVLDEYGGTAGVVSLQDVMDEVVGDVFADREGGEEITQDGGFWQIPGRAPLADVNEALQLSLPVDRFATLAGYLLHRLGRLPQGGERVDVDAVSFRVEEVEGHRIARVRANRRPAKGQS